MEKIAPSNRANENLEAAVNIFLQISDPTLNAEYNSFSVLSRSGISLTSIYGFLFLQNAPYFTWFSFFYYNFDSTSERERTLSIITSVALLILSIIFYIAYIPCPIFARFSNLDNRGILSNRLDKPISFYRKMVHILCEYRRWLQVIAYLGFIWFHCFRMISKVVSGQCRFHTIAAQTFCNPYATVGALPPDPLLTLAILPIALTFLTREKNFWMILIASFSAFGSILYSQSYIGFSERIYYLITYFLIMLLLLYDARYHSLGVFFVFKDLKQTILETEKAADVKHLNEMRHLVGNVAHDLKTPLSAFINGVDFIRVALEDLQTSTFFDKLSSGQQENIYSSIASMLDCIRNMKNTNSFMLMTMNRCIDFTKASKGLKLIPNFDTIDLLDTLTLPLNCIREIQSTVSIEVNDLPPELCRHVITDRQWLQENILCLLSNAVKYSVGGKVQVKLSLEEQTPVGEDGKDDEKNMNHEKDSEEMEQEEPDHQMMLSSCAGGAETAAGTGEGCDDLQDLFDEDSEPIKYTPQPSGGISLSKLSVAMSQRNVANPSTTPGVSFNTTKGGSRHHMLGDEATPSSATLLPSWLSWMSSSSIQPAAAPSPVTNNLHPKMFTGLISHSAVAAISPQNDQENDDTTNHLPTYAQHRPMRRTSQQRYQLSSPFEPSFRSKNHPNRSLSVSSNVTTILSFNNSQKNNKNSNPRSSNNIQNIIAQNKKRLSMNNLTISPPNHEGALYIRFEVMDQGIGIDNETMKQLFSPFRQAQRLTGGTGLGLYSLAKRIEALNGHYGVRQRKDGFSGCIFWFDIPYRPDFAFEAHSLSIHRTSSGGFSFNNAGLNPPGLLKPLSPSSATAPSIQTNNERPMSYVFSRSIRESVVSKVIEGSRENSEQDISVSDDSRSLSDRGILTNGHSVSRFSSCSSPKAGDDKQHSARASERKINTVYEHDHEDYIPTIPMLAPHPNEQKRVLPSSPTNSALKIIAPKSPPPPLPANVPKKLKILVVDDSPTILKMTNLMFRRMGHEITTAVHGVDALQKIFTQIELFQQRLILQQQVAGSSLGSEAQEGSSTCNKTLNDGILFDVILIDMQMPIMDGIETTKRLRQYESVVSQSSRSGMNNNRLPMRRLFSQIAGVTFHDTNEMQNAHNNKNNEHNSTSSTNSGSIKSTAQSYSQSVTSVSSIKLQQDDTLREYFQTHPFNNVIIGMSANSDHETMDDAIAAGIDAFIAKPFSIELFHETYDRVMVQRQVKLEEEREDELRKDLLENTAPRWLKELQ